MVEIKKRLLIGTLIAVSALLSACDGSVAEGTLEKEDDFAIPVAVTDIQRQDISSKFHTTATLESRNEADIISRVTGIIEQLNVEEGDYVEKGQLLVKIDARRYQLALNKADAELAGIKSELERLSSMTSRKLVSEQSADKLKFQYKAAVAAREIAALDLQDSRIKAPIAGYISRRYVKVGHFTQGYQKLLHIVDQSSLQAIVYLPEHQLNNIRQDQEAMLSFSARPGKKFLALVRSISPVIDNRSGTFKVIMSLDNKLQQLKPGMFAQIALTFDTHQDVLTVPTSAIVTLDQNSKIFLVKDNKAVEVAVTQGFVQDQRTEVSGAIKAGEKIVIKGQHNLKADVKVEVINLEEADKSSFARTD